MENDLDLLKSGYRLFSEYQVERSLYIENVLYTLSDKKVKMNSLSTLVDIGEVEL